MNRFSELVNSDWSLAVFEATDKIHEMRAQVIEGLNDSDPEIRSAAVATLNEANDANAHDDIIALINDKNHLVRGEVVEYLTEFAVKEDIPLLLSKFNEFPFDVSEALNRLCKEGGPTIQDDDEESYKTDQIENWYEILRRNKFIT